MSGFSLPPKTAGCKAVFCLIASPTARPGVFSLSTGRASTWHIMPSTRGTFVRPFHLQQMQLCISTGRFWARNTSKNNCAANGAHTPMKLNGLPCEVTAALPGSYGNAGWWLCCNCSVLFLKGAPGRCQSGVGKDHDAGDGIQYAVCDVSRQELIDLLPNSSLLVKDFGLCETCGSLYYVDGKNQTCTVPSAYANGRHTPGFIKYALHASSGWNS